MDCFHWFFWWFNVPKYVERIQKERSTVLDLNRVKDRRNRNAIVWADSDLFRVDWGSLARVGWISEILFSRVQIVAEMSCVEWLWFTRKLDRSTCVKICISSIFEQEFTCYSLIPFKNYTRFRYSITSFRFVLWGLEKVYGWFWRLKTWIIIK